MSLNFNFPAGRLKIVTDSTTCTNGDATVDIRPGAGKKWWVLYGHAYHDDDAAARTMTPVLTDGTTTITGTAKSLANTAIYNLSSFRKDDVGGVTRHSTIMPFILTRDTYMRMTAASLATGHKVEYQALVLELDDL